MRVGFQPGHVEDGCDRRGRRGLQERKRSRVAPDAAMLGWLVLLAGGEQGSGLCSHRGAEQEHYKYALRLESHPVSRSEVVVLSLQLYLTCKRRGCPSAWPVRSPWKAYHRAPDPGEDPPIAFSSCYANLHFSGIIRQLDTRDAIPDAARSGPAPAVRHGRRAIRGLGCRAPCTPGNPTLLPAVSLGAVALSAGRGAGGPCAAPLGGVAGTRSGF